MADFTNIDGVYAKDTELRSGIDTLRRTVLSNTIKPLTVTKNDTYTAIPSSGTYGYSPITVDVQEEPWEPLQDGYSNFWFELTNDTLSPWLNFSAKTESAVIDWGDGSGEQALTTLTPTHTYSNPGRYVVKVKGVTGIAQILTSADSKYFTILKNVELNADVNTIGAYSFVYCTQLENIDARYVSTIQGLAFQHCINLKNIKIDSATLNGNATFYTCMSLTNLELSNNVSALGATFAYFTISMTKFTVPSSVTSIGNGAFQNSGASEYHIQAVTPPTLGNNVFSGVPNDFIIYVPVGTGDTYKAASGWSTYADHIVEEGQSLSKSQLRAIVEEQKKSDNGEEMR